MNINDNVWIRLTEAGVKLWREKRPNQYVYEDGRWFGIQLHEFANLFGGSFKLWDATPYIVDNEIATEKPKELSGFTPPKAPVVNPALPPDGRLTRTEIFLRLVDSFCRQPRGITDGGDPPKGPLPIEGRTGELIKTTEWVYNTWGGK